MSIKIKKILIIAGAVLFLALIIFILNLLGRPEQRGDGIYGLKLTDQNRITNKDGSTSINGKITNVSGYWVFSPKVRAHYCCATDGKDISMDTIKLGSQWWPMFPSKTRSFKIDKASVDTPYFPTLYFDTRWY